MTGGISFMNGIILNKRKRRSFVIKFLKKLWKELYDFYEKYTCLTIFVVFILSFLVIVQVQ